MASAPPEAWEPTLEIDSMHDKRTQWWWLMAAWAVALVSTLGGTRPVSGVLCPPAPTRNNPSHIHQGGAGSDQGDSDQQQVAAA